MDGYDKRAEWINSRRIAQRYSIGIACIRFSANRPEMLMVKKRYTYAYSDFVHGKYPQVDFRRNKAARADILRLFDNMTVEEKLDILSLDFGQIWYRVWLNSPKPPVYYTAKNKFETTFLIDGGNRLRKLINKSKSVNNVWEIPKGRKKSRVEPDVICAIREFSEETNIAKNAYRLMMGLKKTYSYIDNGIQYNNTYYIAVARHHIEPNVNFAMQDQINEISDIRWMNIDEIKFVGDKILQEFAAQIFKIVKKYNKLTR